MPKEDLLPDHTTIQIRLLYIVVRNPTSDQKACSFTGLTRTFERATIKLFTRPLTSFSGGMLSTNVILGIPLSSCLYATHSVLVSPLLHCGHAHCAFTQQSGQPQDTASFKHLFWHQSGQSNYRIYSCFSFRLPVHFFILVARTGSKFKKKKEEEEDRKWTLLQQA